MICGACIAKRRISGGDVMDYLRLGQRIRKQRKLMGMTQKDVADLLGISQSYISRLEKKIIQRLRKEIAKMV